MFATAETIFWALIILAELFAAYIFVVWRIAREFRFFVGCMLFRVVASVAEYVVLKRGWLSAEYYLYFTIAEVLGATILYASVGELVLRTVKSAWITKHLVGLFIAGYLVAVMLSIENSASTVFSVSETLFWLSGTIVAGLCVRYFWQMDFELRRHVVAFQLANVLGVYFVLWAAAHALQHLTYGGVTYYGGNMLAAVASAWLPIGASLVAMSAPQSPS